MPEDPNRYAVLTPHLIIADVDGYRGKVVQRTSHIDTSAERKATGAPLGAPVVAMPPI
jgi:hypothetical protein